MQYIFKRLKICPTKNCEGLLVEYYYKPDFDETYFRCDKCVNVFVLKKKKGISYQTR